MHKIKQLAVGCLALLAGAPAMTRGESLWQKRTAQNGYLFYDSKARNVGDLLTVIVSQSTGVANTESREMNKETSITDAFKLSGSSSGGFGGQGAATAMNFSNGSSREFDGGASYSAAQEFNDRLTFTVMDVLPNGNLVISGSRRVSIAGEERTLMMTGIVRGIDIGPDNTIASRFIADQRTYYEAAGASQKFARQNWLGRVTNRVWPF